MRVRVERMGGPGDTLRASHLQREGIGIQGLRWMLVV